MQPTEQSKAAASSNQFVRKQYRKPDKKVVKKKPVYRKKIDGRAMVKARNTRRQYVKVEDCTSMYLLSLLDPTSEMSRGACIPSGFPMPSQKARAYCRGSFNSGTSGDGYILFRPTLVNDAACLTFTGSASVGTAGTAFSAFTNIISDQFAKLPFTTAQLVTNSEVAGRIVSACLRIRYAGTEASRAGLLTSLEHPDHGTIANFSANDIAQFESAYRERPNADGQWCSVHYSGPTQPRELEYVNTVNASEASTTNWPIMGITMNGTAASASYEYEAWINVEYIGKITNNKSLVKIDEQGYGNVIQAVKGSAGTKSLSPESAPSVLAQFGNAVIENMPQIVGYIGKGINAFSPGSMLGQAAKTIWGLNPQAQRITY